MSHSANRLRRLWLSAISCVCLLSACASAPSDYVTQTTDPWEKFNRSIYAFNDKLDKNIARPVASTYIRAVPAPARNGIHNVIDNLDEPSTIVNDLLQGKLVATLKDSGRFIVNSSVGLLGFFDVASHIGLPDHTEDLGETLASWGVPSGPYLVIPIIGPSTVRDAGGRVGDIYTDPPKRNLEPRYYNAETLLDGIDTRAGLMGANSTLDSAYDPYTFMRDAYVQHRRFLIYDGNPPVNYPDLPSDDDTNQNASPVPATTTSSAPQASTTTIPPNANGGSSLPY